MTPLVPEPPPRRIAIAPRSLALVLASVGGVYLAYRLWTVVLILVVALILAGTFNPVVEWMEGRGIRRLYALVLLFVALVMTTALLLFLTVPPLVDQLTQIIKDAPDTRRRLIALLNERSITTPLAHAVQDAGLKDAFARLESHLLGYSSDVAQVIGYGATTLVLSFYLLSDGPRAQGVVYAMVPRDYHMRLARILRRLEVIVGGYVRGQVITSAALGAFTLVLLLAFRVPNALSLALFAALVDVIPFVGGLLVVVPAALSALAVGVPAASMVLGALLLYMEFESRVLVPRIYGHVLRLPATAVILALLIGGTLMGVMGALLALPIAAGLLMILEELRVEMPGDDSVDQPARSRDAQAEAAYEQMSAGSTAPEAGQIAKALAQEAWEGEEGRAAAVTVPPARE